jgi:Tfp pilus assembly protein PilF
MNSSSSKALAAIAVALAATLAAPGASAQALRPDIGKPLQAAQALVKAGKYREALAEVKKADAVGGRTSAENLLIERMRIAAASGAGDVETLARSYEVLDGSAGVTAAEKLRMVESIAGSYYRAGQYAKAQQWAQRYLKEGGTSASMRQLLVQAQYQAGDFAAVTRELGAEVAAAEKAGQTPSEERLKLYLNAAMRQKDATASAAAMEKLVTYYPKKEYWVDLLSRLKAKPTFSDRFSLDTYRLSLATGSMASTADFMEMAQLSLQADLPAESKQVVDKGFASGALGTGPEAQRHGRLRDLVAKRLGEEQAGRAAEETAAQQAKSGDALVNLGFNLVFAGQAKKGVQTIEQGIAKGGLKRADDAKLRLGIAQLMAGDKAKAQSTFRTVQGTDGAADLARLWSLYARRSA